MAVSVNDDGLPEVVDLKKIAKAIADADRFATTTESEWQHHLERIMEARRKAHEAIKRIKSSNQSNADALRRIREAKDKLLEEEHFMFSGEKKGTDRVLSDHIIHNLDTHLDEARRQIQAARAKLHSEPSILLWSHREDSAQEEAMSAVDELLKVQNDLLPAQQAHGDEEALAVTDKLLNKPDDILAKEMEEMETEQLIKLEQALMKELTNSDKYMSEQVDNVTQHHRHHLVMARLEKIRKAGQLVNEIKNPMFASKSRVTVPQEMKRAKAMLFEEEKAKPPVGQPQHVLSDHVISNLDDHLAEAREQIKDARARLAAEPPLFPDGRLDKAQAPANHEKVLRDIRRDIRKVRVSMAQQTELPVVRKEQGLVV